MLKRFQLLLCITHKVCVQCNLVNMNSRGPSKTFILKRNFTITVATCISVIMPGDFNVVRKVFSFNSVCINEAPLYIMSQKDEQPTFCMHSMSLELCFRESCFLVVLASLSSLSADWRHTLRSTTSLFRTINMEGGEGREETQPAVVFVLQQKNKAMLVSPIAKYCLVQYPKRKVECPKFVVLLVST